MTAMLRLAYIQHNPDVFLYKNKKSVIIITNWADVPGVFALIFFERRERK